MKVTASAIPAAKAQSRGWVRSPIWDLFWMFSALWSMALLLGLSEAIGFRRAWILFALPSGALAVWHSWSTSYMVLGSPLFKEQRGSNPLRYRVYPLLIVGLSMSLGIGMVLSHRYPTGGPFGLEVWPWGLYLILFWVGHFWHFGNQDFGVLSIYRAKAGQTRPIDRRVDKLYAVTMMFVIQPIVYLAVIPKSPFSDIVYNFFPVEREVLVAASSVCVAAACLLTAGVMGLELRKNNTSLQKLLYYSVMLTHPVLLFYISSGIASFYFIAYFLSHWFIAIGLVGRINTGHHRAQGKSRSRSVSHHLFAIGLITTLIMACTWEYKHFSLFSGGKYKQILASIGKGEGLLIGCFIGFFLAEQLLHYYCDRSLFRFRDPGVRKSVWPLI